MEDGLLWLPWPAVITGIGFVGLWINAMETMALVVTAVILAVSLGIPSGILGARINLEDSYQDRSAPHSNFQSPRSCGMLRLWDFTAASQVAAEGWIAENEASLDEAAIWFLENDDIWPQWLTNAAASEVKTSLDSSSHPKR